jgi:shikimate 5-dehydrogenase
MKDSYHLGLIRGHNHSSKSHLIYQKLFDLFIPNVKFDYSYYEVRSEELETIVNLLLDKTLDGLSVTNPYKKEILKYSTILDPLVQEVKMSNCLSLESGSIKAFNTDYLGFLSLLEYYDFKIKYKHILILGTGSISSLVGHILKDNSITYVSRTPNGREQTISYEQTEDLSDIDYIINTSSTSDLFINYKYKTIYIDLNCDKGVTKFTCKPDMQVDGYVMLIAQAIQAFEIFTSSIISDKMKIIPTILSFIK